MRSTPIVVAHGGTDSHTDENDGPEAACARALERLDQGHDALEAAVSAVEVLEADGRTIELDAGVMDTEGRLGAVAGVEEVVHVVRLARHVADTPHVLIVGRGATDLAKVLGLHQPFEPTEKVRRMFADYVKQLDAAGPPRGPQPDTESDAGRALVKRYWNYAVPWQQMVDQHGHGTVGAVVRDAEGRFAVAVSTAGSPPSLRGRVADIPLVGCGFYAGPKGAVACSGIGEHNVRHLAAFRVVQWLEQGMALREALERGLQFIPPGLQAGMIGVTATEAEVASRRPMAHARRGR